MIGWIVLGLIIIGAFLYVDRFEKKIREESFNHGFDAGKKYMKESDEYKLGMGYQDGFNAGYHEGYTTGFDDAKDWVGPTK